MRIVVTTVICLAALFAAALADAQEPAPPKKAVPQKVMTTCIVCHGLNGDSTSSDVPRLNGQQAGYLVARLHSFLYPGNQDPHATAAMWGVVSAIDDATLATLADYYARQAPTPLSSTGRLAAAGKKLYENGDPATHIPACQTCHGADAGGHGSIPRLAGQHTTYLRNQIERLRFDLRASEPMHMNAAFLSEDQISALAAYLGRN